MRRRPVAEARKAEEKAARGLKEGEGAGRAISAPEGGGAQLNKQLDFHRRASPFSVRIAKGAHHCTALHCTVARACDLSRRDTRAAICALAARRALREHCALAANYCCRCHNQLFYERTPAKLCKIIGIQRGWRFT